MNRNKESLARLTEVIYSSLDPVIDRDYCLLDIPDHTNIGDQLIYQGELEYLKRLPYRMLYSSNDKFYDFRKITDNCLILLHGGGNFGDLYRGTQDFRIRVIKRFTRNKIVIFPQSVFYSNTEIAIQDAQIFGEHPDLTICARDKNSYQFLKQHFFSNKILMVPDMAFCLNLDNYITGIKTNKVLILKRLDKELNEHFEMKEIKALTNANQTIKMRDWPSMQIRNAKFRLLSLLNYVNKHLANTFNRYSFLRPLLNDKYGLLRGDLSKWYKIEGIKFMMKYDEVYSTRLHGYILAILLNKKVHMLDNSYGKNSNFYHTWMSDFTDSEFVTFENMVKKDYY
jgi:pyruvyl transferase EpsO